MGNTQSESGGSFRNESPMRISEPANIPRMWLPVHKGQIWLTVLIFGILVFFFGLALDLFLISQESLRPVTAAAILDGLLGFVAAALLFRVLSFDRERRQQVLERLEVIDEMNHHIRNALQVISFNAHESSSNTELAEIQDSVNRIQWALREILPKVEPEFTGLERKGQDTSVEL